jgi:hypothetical protein
VAVVALIAVVGAAVLYMLAGGFPPVVGGSPTPFAVTTQSSFSLDIRVDPPIAKIGDPVTIYLTNYPPNAPVVIEWGHGESIATGVTDGDGAFSSEYVVQRANAGTRPKRIYAYAYKDVPGQEQQDSILYTLATPAPSLLPPAPSLLSSP